MADGNHSIVAQSAAMTALTSFYNNFTQNNAAVTSSNIQTITTNNINAINTLLTSLMGNTADQKTAQDALTTTVSTSPNTKPGLPTYNTRTPYTEIYINGALAVGGNKTSQFLGITTSSLNSSNILSGLGIEVLFQDLELSMPFGGVSSTITGTLKLYSRTPVELLTFLTDGLDEDSGGIINEIGLPICEVIMGWNIADGTADGLQIRSPKISFIVTNIQMSDPGKTMGSEFTLTLQDAGSASLQNSSNNMGLLADYPQQQLRQLIEKVLGLRLFTLDDLLQLGYNQQNAANGLANKQNVNFQNETFFTNQQAAPFRINYNLLDNAVSELLNYISCRWYPIDNSTLQDSIIAASTAEANIRDLQNSLQNNSITQEEAASQYATEVTKLATTCVLIWVPYFPANVYTTSNTVYLEPNDLNSIGAFLLLPKYVEDTGLASSNLPVIYGPGGSGIPYFYGGAQNIFQKLADLNSSYSKTGFSNTVGEVYDLTLNFNNYIAIMKNDYDEEVVMRENGKFLYKNNMSKLHYNKASKTSKQAVLQNSVKQQLQGKYRGANGDILTPEQVLEQWKNTEAKKFKVTRGKFKHSIGMRKLMAGDSEKTLAGPAKDRTYANADKMKNYALSKLQNRIGAFLTYPLTIGMTVMGDPYLLRQGIGCFEIINYYPTLDGQSFKFNPIVSGVYVPQTIIHRISLGDYVTEIRGLKVPNSVDNTMTKAYSYILSNASGATGSSTSTTNNISNIDSTLVNYNTIVKDIMQVNLENLTSPTTNFSTNKATTVVSLPMYKNNQTDILTGTILTGNLKAQLQATLDEFTALNKKSGN